MPYVLQIVVMITHGPVAIQPEEFRILEKDHYEDPLLETMRSHGLGGPIAAMLCPDAQALVIFGSILDSWVLKAGKLLAKEFGFPVMIRPPTDDPVTKWSLANISADGLEIRGKTRKSYTDTSQDEGSSDSSEDHEDEDRTSEEDIGSDTEDLGNMDSVFRLRGGSGTSRDAYDPKKGPVHNLDIHLAFHQKMEATNAGQGRDLNDRFEPDVSIYSKIRFTVQSTYTDEHLNGYQPQYWFPCPWRKVHCKMHPVKFNASSHTFHWIVRATEPKHTTKTVETKTRDMTGTLSLIGGIHPTGGGTLAIQRSKATAKEKQNDRVCQKDFLIESPDPITKVTPAWSVHYDSGAKWSTKEQSYPEKNVSFSSSEGKQDGMDVEYSIGINVGDPQNALRAPLVPRAIPGV
ncbi:hypothetical protein B0H13DRAFT_1883764 [Mycena leptocephala]|nr:hypothetical protein B0H13DRAFT_1883764 [Mycena leptocephala]